MAKCELGDLFRGDEFYFEGQKYKSLYLKGNNFNNVVCVNMETGKRKYFDIGTEVEVRKYDKQRTDHIKPEKTQILSQWQLWSGY